MPHIPEPQYECFTCEHYFTRTSALMDGVPAEYATEYCTRACQQQFTEQLEAGAQASKDAGLDELQRAAASTTSLTGIAVRYGLKLGK
jgi:hypothetical protein